MNARGLLAAASIALAACSAGGSQPYPSTAPANLSGLAAPSNAYAFSPYVDMTAYPPFEFGAASKATGTLYYTMAFVVSYQATTCEGAWGGIGLPADATYGGYVSQQLAAIRTLGGDGILSFGGASGKELAWECPDAASLAKAYEKDIDFYKTTHIDFDIEGNSVYDQASVERRSQALAALQHHYAALGKPVTISYTLAVVPSGMPDPVLAVVKSALAAGVKIDIVNLMTMDFGKDNAPHPNGRMGTYAIESVQSAAAQLKKIGFPFGANPYASLGVTPMIGVNDVAAERFMPSDAQTLLTWAQANHPGRLSFWAAQRDIECKGGVKRVASDTCSSILQTPGEFAKIFAPYQ